jgi:WD repeat and SOF domain-containing protein 1
VSVVDLNSGAELRLIREHGDRWQPFDPSRNWPDLGPLFANGEKAARAALRANSTSPEEDESDEESVFSDKRDLDWATVLKRTFESYVRGERPNMYGEWLQW